MRQLASMLATATALALLGIFLVGPMRLRLAPPPEDRYPVLGIDVSRYQEDIDWQAVAADGYRFAFIKATEGTDLTDPSFDRNWSGAGDAGILRSPYHFFTFCTPGRDQARNFLRVAPPEADSAPRLPPSVDIEFPGNCKAWTSLEGIRTELRIFLAEVEQAWGMLPVLYLTRTSYSRVAADQFDHYPMWLRNLYWEPTVAADRSWAFWQYSDSGEVAGIRGGVDLNAFRGEDADLLNFAEKYRIHAPPK